MSITIDKSNIKELTERAMENGDIKVYYQPKHDAINGKAVGAEALARWIAPDGEVISPGRFVPLLEEMGLIMPLDWYMLENVCKFLNGELKAGRPVVVISVNCSRLHTVEKDYAERLCATVDKYAVPHELIEIEITESALASDEGDVISFVRKIRDAGFSVSIDDFGSGLSSLNFVKDVPANVIKIDKSLLSGNCENEKERIVLESIFDFAHRLKLITVAEGVETKEQLGFLRTCGCELIQGFLFAKPMPEEDFRAALKNSENHSHQTEDILLTQPPATATQLLLDVIFKRYPLVIMSNLSRNSFYMMAYENFSTRSCPSTGVYTELIGHGASTMHPDDRKLFSDTFDINDQLSSYEKGERTRRVVTRQLGDDGVYRRVETTNYYLKNPSADDVLAITLSKAVED
ncbi:MAG: EAL domain-containing protein [Firmicutes bacterium]|nr:EAL domain-containing protein [[Eubacterium] siraeum]MCM1487319.1 EAL domain-containing protein [Bacillota bacterium]